MKNNSALKERLRNLYDAYRTSLLNQRYYGCRLYQFKRVNLAMEIVVASLSSSAVAAWAIWSGGWGARLWAVLTGLAALIAILKPIVRLSDQVERYSKLFSAHGSLAFDLEQLVEDVRHQKEWVSEMEIRYRRLSGRLRDLSPQDDPKPDKALLRRCYEEILAQVPVEQLWMPEEVSP